jgi:transketolase
MNGEDRENTHKLRKNIFCAAYSYTGWLAHLASAFSVVELVYALYMKGILKYDPRDPAWDGRDYFIMSKGHASLAAYAILAMAKFFEEEELWTFCRPGARLGGEANMRIVPGVEASTGSLGHGFSFGVGIALANKMDGKNSQVYVLLGDGECEEGTIWEAVMSSVRYRLDNLTVILDFNKIQKMGPVKDTMSIESWESRWESFGWEIVKTDGHDIDSIMEAFGLPRKEEKPRLIIADTVKGKGVSIMENNPEWHFKMPNKRELKIVLAELGITEGELEKCRKHTCSP